MFHGAIQKIKVASFFWNTVYTAAGANLAFVDKFYYLGDKLSVDRDDDAALETRIGIGCNKFRQLQVGTIAYPYGYIIDYERETIWQLCAN